MFDRGKARIRKELDKTGKRPERNRLGRGEAVLHLLKCKRRRPAVGLMVLWSTVSGTDRRVLHFPMAVPEHGASCVDAHNIGVSVAFLFNDKHILQFNALLRDCPCMDNGVTRVGRMAEPQAVACHREKGRPPLEVACFEDFMAVCQQCGPAPTLARWP